MSDAYEPLRKKMIQEQLMARHIDNEKVVTAMYKIPRHLFVHPDFQKSAYDDRPLPIGNDQTISQPFMVGLMTQLLELKGGEKVLDIGTGSGYQTAVLAEIADFVYSIERHENLARQALNRLRALGYKNVEVLVGDGTRGLPSQAPFDAILVAATGPIIPGPLRTQMADGGRMVLPVGDGEDQHLMRVWRDGDRWEVEKILKVRFVPLLGRYGFVED